LFAGSGLGEASIDSMEQSSGSAPRGKIYNRYALTYSETLDSVAKRKTDQGDRVGNWQNLDLAYDPRV